MVEGKKVGIKETVICNKCGHIISGNYEYIKTGRKTELFFHENMKCPKIVKGDQI